MTRTMRLALGTVVILAAATMASAQAPAAMGERLERQMWEAFKAKDWAAVEQMIAPGFQSVHEDGARDKAGEMTLIRGLNIAEYTLSDFKVTGSGQDLIVTYRVSVPETIDGKRLDSKPAMRVSVWQQTAAGWQWITHVNLRALQ